MQQDIVVDGIVVEALPNTIFLIEIGNATQKKVISAHLAGKLRKNYIKILPGDGVRVQIKQTDINRGIIIFRK
jgi:translation initiation factor IF-1